MYVFTADVLHKVHTARATGDPDLRAAADSVASWLAFVMSKAQVKLDDRVAPHWDMIKDL